MTRQRGQGNGEPRLSPRRVNAMIKQAKAIELRSQDWTWEAIAAELGYRDRSGAIKAADAALRRMPDVEDRERWQKVESVRLELYLAGILGRALAGDLDAIKVALAIAQRKAKLLGLDAPEEIILGGSGEPIRVEVLESLDPAGLELARQLRERVAGQRELRSGDPVIDGEAEEEA